eukprot:symbB.v1.2.021196.t1/scaffold1819.1/size114121/5
MMFVKRFDLQSYYRIECDAGQGFEAILNVTKLIQTCTAASLRWNILELLGLGGFLWRDGFPAVAGTSMLKTQKAGVAPNICRRGSSWISRMKMKSWVKEHLSASVDVSSTWPMDAAKAQRASTPKEVPIAGGPERFTMADLKGRLPVHLGALSKRLDTMTLLLELEADVNAVDLEGNTPLMLAARSDDRWMVEVLLTFGADADLKNVHEEDCFSGSSQVMQDYIHKWLQQKRFRGLVEFPLPPSPLHAVYRVRVDCLPMLIYQDELEDAVVQFFAKLLFEKPFRVIVPANPISACPWALCMRTIRRSNMHWIFAKRRRWREFLCNGGD